MGEIPLAAAAGLDAVLLCLVLRGTGRILVEGGEPQKAA